MPPQLDRRFADLRRRVRQALLTHGVSLLAAITVGSVLIVCLADWLFHFDDSGVRLILLVAVLAGAIWAAQRFLVVPLRFPFSNLDLALRIEDRFPIFRDSLASSVEFLEKRGDPRVGSPALQQAVIREALARIESLDCSAVLQTRPVRRTAVVAAAVCLFATLIAVLDLTQSSIALRRLALPFSALPWPRQFHLRLLDAELRPLDSTAAPVPVIRGDVLKLYAESDSGRLPGRVDLEFEAENGKIVVEPMRPMTKDGADGRPRELAAGQLPAVKGEVRFRAVGGDDHDMPWHRLRVVSPAVVDGLRVTLTPPPYAKRGSERLPEGVGHVQGLVGTRVDIVATVNKPVVSAGLRLRDQPRERVKVSDEGRRLEASFVITEPGSYAWGFELHDEQGIENSDPTRYDVRAVADTEPEVRIDEPASDLQATPDAEIPLRTVARDDLGLKEIRLAHRPDEGEWTTIPLFDAESRPKEQAVDYVWKLSESGFSEGMRIVFRTEATDDFDLTPVFPEGKAPPPHVGRSVSRALTIVSKEDKARELAQRQAGLLEELERVFKSQKQAHDQVGDLRIQLENAGKLRPTDLDLLQRTEIGQRELSGRLMHPANGVIHKARAILEEQRENHLDDPQLERRLSDIAGELERLGDENLSVIEQELTQARKLLQSEAGRRPSPAAPAPKNEGARRDESGKNDTAGKNDATGKSDAARQGTNSPTDPPAEADKNTAKATAPTKGAQRDAKASERPETALRQAAENQEAVLDSLTEMLQTLAQWRTEHDVSRELWDVIRQQQELRAKTGELGTQTLTKSRDKLSTQQQAELAKLADRQKKQAEQLEQLETRMQEKLDALAQSNPEGAAPLKEALQQAREQRISEQMRDAAGQIGENRMGEASRAQDEVVEKLRELDSTLNQSRESDTETLVKKLKQAESELDQLRDREQELLRKLEQAAQEPDAAERQAQLERLRKEQEQLREETAKMARKLQRLSARKPAASAQRAAARMQRAQESLEEGDQAEAAEEQREAVEDLEQAQRELARERRRAEETLANEQLDKIASQLEAMIGRMQSAIEETKRLEGLKQSAGRLNRAQLKALGDLTGLQRQIKEDTDRLVEKLTAAEVFALALRGAARHIQEAVDLLEQRNTGPETQQAQERARRRFVDLIETLKPDRGEQAPNPPQGADGGEGSDARNSGPQMDGIPALAQLKMLLAMQRDLRERTVALQALRDAKTPLTPAQRAETEALATEQQELADLARNLTRLAAESADANESAPDGSDRKEEP